MEKSKIYTKGGDKGMTSLVSGKRVPKTHLRLETYGTIDELNAFIGLLITKIEDGFTWKILRFVQEKLFAVGAYLATDSEKADGSQIENTLKPEIARLEDAIDQIDSNLPQLRNFVIPGGCPSTALAHVARTVCRRAERIVLRLAEQEPVNESVFIYINRLSDLLFVISRQESLSVNGEEIFLGNPMFNQ